MTSLLITLKATVLNVLLDEDMWGIIITHRIRLILAVPSWPTEKPPLTARAYFINSADEAPAPGSCYIFEGELIHAEPDLGEQFEYLKLAYLPSGHFKPLDPSFAIFRLVAKVTAVTAGTVAIVWGRFDANGRVVSDEYHRTDKLQYSIKRHELRPGQFAMFIGWIVGTDKGDLLVNTSQPLHDEFVKEDWDLRKMVEDAECEDE